MNGINTATCDRVYIRNEIYEKSLAESDVYDPNDDLDLCLSETEEETTLVSRLTPLAESDVYDPDDDSDLCLSETEEETTLASRLTPLAESDVYDPDDDSDLCPSETEEETTLASRLTPLAESDVYDPDDDSDLCPSETEEETTLVSRLIPLAESDVYDPDDDSDLCLSETEEETTLVSRLTPLEDMQICTPGIKSPRQILQGGIRKAFGGETNSIKLRYRLKNMPWGEARKVWQTIANEMAEDCFGPDGNVDVERLKGWMKFLGDAETFKKEPFRFIPHVELMRSQMYVVCECLVLDRNGARDQLNAANGIAVGPHGRSLLAAMSQGRESPLSPTVAILASLFTPHRQWNLPTCTIHSIINAEIRNHPGWLVKVYAQMLQSDQCTLPSGYAVWQQSIQNGSITVDLRNGGKGRDDVFEDITGGDPAKIAEQIAEWQREGIEYDEAEKYKFKMPVYNMTDLLFANILQASNFGNRKIDDYREYGTMLIYAGHRERVEIYSSEIQVDDLNFLAGMAALKERGEAWRRLGCHYMRVSTTSSDGGHAENIDIDALLAFDPNNMETGKAYAISDCNYGDDDMSQDIPRLAVRKMGGTPPTYEFGTLWCGSQFEKVDVSMIWVYATDANVCDAEYWAQFQ